MFESLRRLVVFPVACLVLTGCGGGNQSSLEGALFDTNGEPIAGVTIVAEQLEPLAGYERKEVTTRRDGTFRIRGLYPSSEYVLGPISDLWTARKPVGLREPTVSVITIRSAPAGEVRVLREAEGETLCYRS